MSMNKVRELVTEQYELGRLTDDKYTAAIEAGRSRSERILHVLLSVVGRPLR